MRVSSYSPLWREAHDPTAKARDLRRDRVEIEALNRSDGVFGPGRRIAQAIEREHGIPVRLIETPFELAEVALDPSLYESSPASRGRYLLFFGTLGRLKGVVTIAELLPRLLSRYRDLSFVFIGKDQRYRDQSIVDMLLDAAGPDADRVHCYPKMKHAQLYPFIKGATGVVLPSLIDNFPNTCVEAMSQRRVVIGTLGTSFEQLIEDGKNGFLARPDDANSLMASCDRLLNLPNEAAHSMGDAAYEKLRLLRPDLTVAELECFYRETIARFAERLRDRAD